MDAYITLWDENILIRRSALLCINGSQYPLYEVSASDDTQVLVLICSLQILADIDEALPFIHHKLIEYGLYPTTVGIGNHLFLDSISPLDEEIKQIFDGQSVGIIALVNGHEPGQGTQALDGMKLCAGDILELWYRIGAKV